MSIRVLQYFFTGVMFSLALIGALNLGTLSFANESGGTSRTLTDFQKAETLFNWLESLYPVLLPQTTPTQELEGIIFRNYPNNVFLATYLVDFYYIGDDAIIPLGSVDAVLSLVPGEQPQPGQTMTEPVTGMEFVWVPGGCYQMGCGTWTDNCQSNETPVHEVCLNGFWMGKYEVTQGQWTRIMGSNPSWFQSGENYPVEQVSWNDVQGFISQLNSEVSSMFRLPTEAEWEYAARSGGREERYAGGNELDSLGWFSGNSGNRTHEVGAKAANGLGIHDMSGNVWEWVSDWSDDNYYSVSPRDNPQGPSTGTYRVVRGGAWSAEAQFCRAAFRNRGTLDAEAATLGFRLALSPGQQ